MSPDARTTRRTALRTGAAFTLAELMVVIAIIALLATVAIPSFSAISEGTTRSLAENKLQLAAAAASDLAARSSLDQDVVLAFFYDTDPFRSQRDRGRIPGAATDAQLAALARDEQRVRAQVFIKAGTFPDVSEDRVTDPNAPTIDREVFVPAQTVAPVTLPKGWEVRGYVPAGWMNDDGWYAGPDDLYHDAGGQITGEPQWVFPETAFFSRGDPSGAASNDVLTNPRNGVRRQTFVLRFQGGSGRVVPSDSREILLYDPLISRRPREGAKNLRQLSPYEFADWATLVAAVQSYAVEDAAAPGKGTYDAVQLRQVLGNQSADTVLARPVQQIVLYKTNDLLAGLGARADRGTGTIYPSKLVEDVNAKYELTSPGGNPRKQVTLIRNWIETGVAETPKQLPEIRDPNQPEQAFPNRVYALDLYTGRLREVTR